MKTPSIHGNVLVSGSRLLVKSIPALPDRDTCWFGTTSFHFHHKITGGETYLRSAHYASGQNHPSVRLYKVRFDSMQAKTAKLISEIVPDRRLLHQRKCEKTVKRIAEVERGRSEKFFVEIGPLKNYYPCRGIPPEPRKESERLLPHSARGDGAFPQTAHRPGRLSEARAESIRDKLIAEQYRVTQESGGDERAFTGEFWDKFEKGIYVDVVTRRAALFLHR